MLRRALSCRGGGPAATAAEAVSPLTVASRQAFNIGGRKTRVGSGHLSERSPQVKQGPVLGVPQRIPGTTKVRYTNEKGRTFSFSIPVAQLTHPPTVRAGHSPGGWRNLDTSYCDTGDLEEDMPSPVEDYLRQHTVSSDDAGEAGEFLKLDAEGLRGLQAVFVGFCRDYVLMDTDGMKTSLTYSELNSGPDYEMYDRKSMRKRYWLSIRHRYEDVKDVLWPSAVLDAAAAVAGGEELALPPEEMLEALVWLEAASTFCVRSHRPYDVAPEEDFHPLHLEREVRVLARAVAQAKGADFFLPSDGGATATGAERAAADRYITCAALSAKYGVPFAAFLRPPASVEEEEGRGAGAAGSARGNVRDILTALPPLQKPKDVVRTMSILEAAANTTGGGAIASHSAFVFSDRATGRVMDAELLSAFAELCSPRVFGAADALENVAETELCAVMRFVVALREQNAAFFLRRSPGEEREEGEEEGRAAIGAFTRLVLARCRHLLYRLGGPQTGVMSGDDEYIPLVELQKNTEATNPAALVHYKIGMENAMGMRFVRLRADTSATLVELLGRLDATGEGTGVATLVVDLVQHIAQKAAMGKDKLTLRDVTRVLLLLGKMDPAALGPDPLQGRYGRLFSAMATTIGAEMQQSQRTPEEIAQLLEGLAACRHVPSSYRQVEMVLLRMSLSQQMTVEVMDRAVAAVARLVGSRAVSEGVLQAAAAQVVACGAATPDGQPLSPAALSLARTLCHCRYAALPSLATTLLEQEALATSADAEGGAGAAALSTVAASAVLCAYAAVSAAEDAPEAVELSQHAATLLRALVAALERGGDAAAVFAADHDLFVEVLTAAAALGVAVPLPIVSAVAASVDVPAGALLHSMRTPSQAVSVLESLEALGIPAEGPLYHTTLQYVEAALEAHPSAGGSAASPGVAAADADVAARVLFLQHASDVARAAATAILAEEVAALDAALEHGADAEDGPRRPSPSFEQRSLLDRDRVAKIEEALLRYCAALHHSRDVAAQA